MVNCSRRTPPICVDYGGNMDLRQEMAEKLGSPEPTANAYCGSDIKSIKMRTVFKEYLGEMYDLIVD